MTFKDSSFQPLLFYGSLVAPSRATCWLPKLLMSAPVLLMEALHDADKIALIQLHAVRKMFYQQLPSRQQIYSSELMFVDDCAGSPLLIPHSARPAHTPSYTSLKEKALCLTTPRHLCAPPAVTILAHPPKIFAVRSMLAEKHNWLERLTKLYQMTEYSLAKNKL